MSEQPELWDAAPQMTPEQSAATVVHLPRVHARRTDPYTSDQALKAIAKDGTLMSLIWKYANVYRSRGPFNDTQMAMWIEVATERRQQRNVIARARGLMEDAGLFRQVGVLDYHNRELMHYEISPNNNKEQQ